MSDLFMSYVKNCTEIYVIYSENADQALYCIYLKHQDALLNIFLIFFNKYLSIKALHLLSKQCKIVHNVPLILDNLNWFYMNDIIHSLITLPYK
jgi:hypothetical protein